MTAGLRVKNDAGVIQIDQDTLNFTLKTSGTATCSTADSSGGVTKYTTTIVVTNCEYPLLALADTDKVAHIYTTVSGTTWTFHIMSLVNGATVSYWVFDKAVSSGDPVGLRVYNASSALVYESSLKPLRIVGAGSGTYASGRTYATIQTACGWNWFETNPGGSDRRYQAFYGASKIVSNVVTVGQNVTNGIQFEDFTEFGVGTFTPESYTPPAFVFLVIDVTDL